MFVCQQIYHPVCFEDIKEVTSFTITLFSLYLFLLACYYGNGSCYYGISACYYGNGAVIATTESTRRLATANRSRVGIRGGPCNGFPHV